jgi:hypothetical protein
MRAAGDLHQAYRRLRVRLDWMRSLPIGDQEIPFHSMMIFS